MSRINKFSQGTEARRFGCMILTFSFVKMFPLEKLFILRKLIFPTIKIFFLEKKKFLQKCTSAFTLIELMIVITIFIILSTLGISSYRSIRASLALDLEVDKMVAVLQKSEADAQTTSTTTGPQCIRIVFAKDKGPTKMVAPYKNAFDGCVWSSGQNLPMTFSTDIGIKNDFSVAFIPPSGKMILTGSDQKIGFFLVQNPDLTRTIVLNPSSGTIEKIKP